METIGVVSKFITDVGFPVFVSVVLLEHVLHCAAARQRALVTLTAELRAMRDSIDRLTSLLLRTSTLNLKVHE